ncbi:hypothetical protein FOTG_17545 [Fusarium oxysporum f. sp. vasinfectum 25433]|uniref:Uncharacterized protein n=1 Tax=Fusarium oxysporum f. sp. vasinfectum 25433 TaxID=1089449 RepID=X0LZZ8_FUSOX|nr:hypothetical protein FOTG_17545 [Fusarium oxysporum f. sp. vasinfectum 25433]
MQMCLVILRSEPTAPLQNISPPILTAVVMERIRLKQK